VFPAGGGWICCAADAAVSQFSVQKRFKLCPVTATKEKYSLNPPSFVATPKQIC